MNANPQNKSEILLYKIILFCISMIGEIFKFLIDVHIIRPYKKSLNPYQGAPKVIVSLTTYGRRIKKVHYTIISLLRQSYKPDMVILWLDNDNWNDMNLPKSLLKLKKEGLSIKYCADLKSYKKLIPALQEYPDSIIITCDDDIYYKKNMLQKLMEAHEKWPDKVIAHRAHQITYTDKGELDKYNKWPQEISNMEGHHVFPTSGGGTLYKKEFFHQDMCNVALIRQLCPNADDIWNYFMCLLNNTDNIVLPYKGFIYLPLDVFYQSFHKGSNLSKINCGEDMNDIQIDNIIKYYHLSIEHGKIIRS